MIYDLTWADISAFVVTLAGLFFYGESILAGSTKPQPATWGIWTAGSGLLVWSSREAGAAHVGLAAAFMLGCLGIFLLTLRFGDKKWGWLDTACVAIAGAGGILWALTSDPHFMIAGCLIEDFAGLLPTYRHAYEKPEEESRLGWSLMYLGMLLAVVAITDWDFASAGYPVYMAVANIPVLVLIFRRRK